MIVVIRNLKNKALQRLWRSGETRGLDAKLIKRLELRLDVMDAATDLSQMNRIGWNLHALKGERAGTWSLSVNGPWRITFKWDETAQECFDVDLEQYH